MYLLKVNTFLVRLLGLNFKQFSSTRCKCKSSEQWKYNNEKCIKDFQNLDLRWNLGREESVLARIAGALIIFPS